MHVHAAVPDRSAGVAVLNRIRLWLPVLVAMAGNSPLWRGEDTGFASWRTVIFGRWPVAGPPPAFADGPDYDRRVADLVSSGAIADTGQIYWQARLSEHYPTIEVRCFDVQLTVEDAVMFAGIVRALVATALREEDAGLPVPPARRRSCTRRTGTRRATASATGSSASPAARCPRPPSSATCSNTSHPPWRTTATATKWPPCCGGSSPAAPRPPGSAGPWRRAASGRSAS
ncbi:glutamate-cysteine ligase family protein [Streptomyces stramineus]